MPAKFLFLTNLAASIITPSTTPIERMRRPRRPIIGSPAAPLGVRRAPADDLGDAYAELVVDDDDLAARDQRAVDQQVDGAAGHPVELDDRSRRQGQEVANG